ncbi:MAG TPA: hypothetical protein PKD92_06675 [Novosphingobium sp.]|nr:hypothetical protein [Novosphingobium sp.]
MSELPDRVTGDATGLAIPAHPDALRAGGAAFLTAAFRAGGALAAPDEVAEVLHAEDCEGGSTGRKMRLSVRYGRGDNGLPTRLFVKFSRDFTDPIRDRACIQMESEVRMARLSQLPGFPVVVPRCLFADYQAATGTGILIVAEVRFGEGGIEPHHEKCLDTGLADPLGHYRALVRANARLAGTHRAGGFPAEAIAPLADAAGSLDVSARAPYSAEQLSRRIERLREFAAAYPQLLPAELRDPAFLDRFAAEAPRFCGHEAAIAAALDGNRACNALCHWNANIDNAWFWRDQSGGLACGLLDWGNARVMNIGVALAGSLMAAEADFLVEHLPGLVEDYAAEFAVTCGETLDPGELMQQLFLHNACSGLLWLIDAPTMIARAFPGLEQVSSRFDPAFRGNEFVRNQLQMLTNFLTLWRHFEFGAVLDRFLEPAATL